jgi:hypothetical protein
MRMSNNIPNTNRPGTLPLLNVRISQSGQSELPLRVSCTSSRLKLMTLIEASAEQIVYHPKRAH